MNKKEKRNKMAFAAAMAAVIITGSIFFAPIKTDAAHLKDCNGYMYFRRVDTRTSSYTHNSQYGTCTVSVTEKFNYYECNCGAENSSSRIERREVHNQPHG